MFDNFIWMSRGFVLISLYLLAQIANLTLIEYMQTKMGFSLSKISKPTKKEIMFHVETRNS